MTMTRILLGVIVLTFSCKPTENKLIGKYTYYSNFEVSGQLDLFPNKRFVFNARQGLMSFGTKGAWKVENNRLILNSDKESTDKSILEITDEIRSEKLKIKLFTNNGDSEYRILTTLPFAKVKLTNELQSFELKPNALGEIEITNRYIDSLIVSTIGYIPLREKLATYPKNDLKIILSEELGNMSFDKEAFIIKGHRLIENNKNSGRKIKYRKN